MELDHSKRLSTRWPVHWPVRVAELERLPACHQTVLLGHMS